MNYFAVNPITPVDVEQSLRDCLIHISFKREEKRAVPQLTLDRYTLELIFEKEVFCGDEYIARF